MASTGCSVCQARTTRMPCQPSPPHPKERSASTHLRTATPSCTSSTAAGSRRCRCRRRRGLLPRPGSGSSTLGRAGKEPRHAQPRARQGHAPRPPLRLVRLRPSLLRLRRPQPAEPPLPALRLHLHLMCSRPAAAGQAPRRPRTTRTGPGPLGAAERPRAAAHTPPGPRQTAPGGGRPPCCWPNPEAARRTAQRSSAPPDKAYRRVGIYMGAWGWRGWGEAMWVSADGVWPGMACVWAWEARGGWHAACCLGASTAAAACAGSTGGGTRWAGGDGGPEACVRASCVAVQQQHNHASQGCCQDYLVDYLHLLTTLLITLLVTTYTRRNTTPLCKRCPHTLRPTCRCQGCLTTLITLLITYIYDVITPVVHTPYTPTCRCQGCSSPLGPSGICPASAAACGRPAGSAAGGGEAGGGGSWPSRAHTSVL